MFVEERQDFVVQNISRRESGLVRIEFSEANIGMSVDGRLLIDFANALDVADITRVLAEKKTRMRRLDLTVSFLFFFGLFQSLNLGFSQNSIVLGRPFLQSF